MTYIGTMFMDAPSRHHAALKLKKKRNKNI